jgi:hypothetical protein
MGHKISTVHGVKSEDYYKPGNAINEIWLGDVELISRLPFGDSDLAQAAWPIRGWPKIPWHNFIIPWKRSLDSQEFVDDVRQVPEEKPGGETKDTGGVRIGRWPLSHTAAMAAAASALSVIVMVAFYFPHRLRSSAPRFRGSAGIDEGLGHARTRKRAYAIRAAVATFSLLLGLAGAVLGFYIVGWMDGGWDKPLLIVLDALWALFIAIGFVFSANAVGSLWRDWWLARRWVMHEDSGGSSPSSLLAEELPMDVVSWLERQRHP